MKRSLLYLIASLSVFLFGSLNLHSQSLEEAEELMTKGEELFGQSKFKEAMDCFASASRMHKSISGEVDMEYSTCRLNMGVIYMNLGDYEKAAALMADAARIRKMIVGEGDQRYLNVMFNLGVLYQNIGKYEDALEALLSVDKVMKEGDPLCARVLNAIAAVYDSTGRYDESLPFYLKALECAKKDYGENDPQYAVSLFNVANLYRNMGRSSDALPCVLKAADIFKEKLGTQHVNYAYVVQGVAAVYADLGEHKKSLERNLEALDLFAGILGERHEMYGKSLENTALQYVALAYYDKAIPMLRRAVEIQKESLGESHPSYPYSLANLAVALSSIGDYDSAMDYYSRAVQITEKTMGKNAFHSNTMMAMARIHDKMAEPYKALEINLAVKERVEEDLAHQANMYSNVLNEIGHTYIGLGDFAKAMNHFQASIDNNARKSAWDNELYAVTLSNISVALSRLGQAEKSEAAIEEALGIMKELYGDRHPKYYDQLHNMAMDIYEDGRYEEALGYNMSVLEGRLSLFGENHPSSASSMNAVAACHEALGCPQEADRYYDMALKSYRSVYGENHPKYAEVLADRMVNSIERNQDPHEYRMILDNHNYNVRNIFQYLTEKDREMYIASNYAGSFEIFQMLGAENESLRKSREGAGAIYDSALSFKGLLLGASVEFMNAVRESGDEELINQAEYLRMLKFHINSVNNRTLSERPEDYEALVSSADSLEREIIRKVKGAGAYMDDLKISWRDVEASLSPKDVAVEFVSYEMEGQRFCCPAVLRKGWKSPVVMQPFSLDCPEDELEQMIWRDILPCLKKGDNVYFSPVGALHHMGIEYVADADGRRMCDRYNMCRLSSTRELARRETDRAGRSAVLYGGINYNSDIAQMQAESAKVTSGTRGAAVNFFTSSASSDRMPWARLDGTREEVHAIAPLLEKSGYETVLYSEGSAVEESFKALSGKDNSLIHVATHGFYMAAEGKLSEEMSLERSGLVLSGANNHWLGETLPEGVEDGILTAKEISVMDLHNTDMVVLSACQTGLGDVSGEGVFGLQRAFKKAGSKTLVVSLWEVDDEAAKTMMVEFYANLAKGHPKRQAFREAQDAVKKCTFIKDGIPASGSDPYFWAAFVMID